MFVLHNLWRRFALSALLTVSSVQAQSGCNPLKKAGCPPDPALGGTEKFDFTKGPSDAFTNIGGGLPTYDSNGVSFTAAKSGDSPTLVSKFYIMYGKVETVMKAAHGSGIVSASVLMSDDADEIDWEYLGKDADLCQIMYFSKGQPVPNAGGGSVKVPGGQDGFHTYTMDWTSDALVWSVDGVALDSRTTAKGAIVPSTPAQIKIGIWSAGDPALNPSGPNGWAGATDYSQGPFTMIVQSITVTDYSTGTQYTYSDQSGTWQSIKSTGGQVNPKPVGQPKAVQFGSSGSSQSSAASSSPPATSGGSTQSQSSTSVTSAASSVPSAPATTNGSFPTVTGGGSNYSAPTTLPTNAGGGSSVSYTTICLNTTGTQTAPVPLATLKNGTIVYGNVLPGAGSASQAGSPAQPASPSVTIFTSSGGSLPQFANGSAVFVPMSQEGLMNLPYGPPLAPILGNTKAPQFPAPVSNNGAGASGSGSGASPVANAAGSNGANNAASVSVSTLPSVTAVSSTAVRPSLSGSGSSGAWVLWIAVSPALICWILWTLMV